MVASLDRKRLDTKVLSKTNCTRGVFDKEARRKPLAFATDAVRLWDLDGVSLDNGTLKVGLGGLTVYHCHGKAIIRRFGIEREDLFESLPSSQ